MDVHQYVLWTSYRVVNIVSPCQATMLLLELEAVALAIGARKRFRHIKKRPDTRCGVEVVLSVLPYRWRWQVLRTLGTTLLRELMRQIAVCRAVRIGRVARLRGRTIRRSSVHPASTLSHMRFVALLSCRDPCLRVPLPFVVTGLGAECSGS